MKSWITSALAFTAGAVSAGLQPLPDTRDSVQATSQTGQLCNNRLIAFATQGLMASDLPNLNQPALVGDGGR